MKNSLVSVIVPTYNRSEYLKRCINSVLEQKDDNIEILICDNGSSDNTKQIIQNYNTSKIKWIDGSEMPKHPGAMRNLGLVFSQGEIISFLDDDDYWKPGYLKYVREEMNYCDAFGECVRFFGLEKAKVLKPYHLALSNILIMSSVSVKRHVLNIVGEFPSNKTWVYTDYAMWLRITTVCHFKISKNIFVYYESNNPKSLSKHVQSDYYNLNMVFKDYEKWLLSKGLRKNIFYILNKYLNKINSKFLFIKILPLKFFNYLSQKKY